MKNSRLQIYIIFSMFLLSVSFNAAAQDIEEVYVHGSSSGLYLPAEGSDLLKNGLPLDETPINIQVVPRAVLIEQNATTLQDALRNVSGVQPNFTMGGAYERFTVRGFTQSIAAYRNGILQPVSRFHRANTDRVEVLKGPAALEMGMSDPGGAINVVTRRPTEETQFGFTQTAGSLDEYASIFNASGPLGSDDVLYRVDASWDSYSNFRDVTDTTEFFVAPSLLFNISEATSLHLNLEYADSEYTYDQGVHAWENGLVDLSREHAYGQENALQEYDNVTAELILDHEFNEAWSMRAGYVASNSETYFRAIYASGNPSPGNTVVNRSAWFGPEETKTQSLWLTFNGNIDTGSVEHHLTFGVQANTYEYDGSASVTFIEQVDVFDYRAGDSAISISAYDNLPKTDFIHVQDDEFQGYFIQDQIYFTEQLIVLLGLRHDKVNSDFYDFYGPDGGPYIGEDKIEDSETTGRLGLMYKTDRVSPFVSYSTSYGPGFNYLPFEIYEPEQAEQLEAGVKINAFDGRAQVSVSIYDLVKSNIPTPHPDIPGRTVTIGEAESKGIEVDIIGALSSDWSIMANLALMDSEVTRDYSGIEGNELPNAPHSQAGFWLRYSPGTFALGGGATYVSERYGMANNSYRDDAYTRFDLFAAYDFMFGSMPATARLVLNNITDEQYYNMRNRWSNMPSEPFNAVASLSLHF